MVRSGVRAPIVLGGKPSPFRCVGSNSEERLENPSDLLENSCNDHLQTSRPHTSNLQVPLAFHNSSAESTPRGFRYISSSLHCGAPPAHIQATALNVSPRPLSTVVVTIRHWGPIIPHVFTDYHSHRAFYASVQYHTPDLPLRWYWWFNTKAWLYPCVVTVHHSFRAYSISIPIRHFIPLFTAWSIHTYTLSFSFMILGLLFP